MLCDTCARKKICGETCDGFVARGRPVKGHGKGRRVLEFHGDMAGLEDIETGRKRRVRRPIDYAE